MLNERNRNRSLERGLVQGSVVYHSSRPGMYAIICIELVKSAKQIPRNTVHLGLYIV